MKKMLQGLLTITGVALFCVAVSAKASVVVHMHWVDQKGHSKKMGTVRADDTIYGLLLTPNLQGLSPGVHGFHVHVMPSCDNHAMAAGGHLDPMRTGVHHGPYRGDGHLGDLPVLVVDQDGRATLPVLAPRLTLALFRGHALIVHEGGDDYTDAGLKKPGAMVRIGCGVIAE